MEIKIILIIIIWHFVADFVCQTEWQAVNKSKNIQALLQHTITYSALWFPICTWIIFPESKYPYLFSILFIMITFVTHTITDFLTSKLNTKLVGKIRKDQLEAYRNNSMELPKIENFLFAIGKGKWHNFFVSIGFDQVLHYSQLFLTLEYINQLT